MLARFRPTTTRAANFNSSRLRAVTGRPCRAAVRTFHHATGEFTKLGPEGTLVTEEVSIQVGDPGEAYVCIPTEVGYALQASGGAAHTKRPDRLAITYFHDTHHFAFGNCHTLSYLVVSADILIVRLVTWLPPRSRSSTASPPICREFKPSNIIPLRLDSYNRSRRNQRWYINQDPTTLLVYAC